MSFRLETQLFPDMTVCINTTAVIEPRLMQKSPHRDVDMWGRV